MLEHPSNNSYPSGDAEAHARLQRGAGQAVLVGEQTAVSVVVPCFNEEASLPLLGRELSRLAGRLGDRYDFEFLLVDDGSTDGTRQALCEVSAARPDCRVIAHPGNRGITAAIMTGIRQARSEIVCSMDCDCTYDPVQLERMIPMLADDVDMVTASPYHPQGRVCNVPRWRLAISKAASLLYRRVCRAQLHCYTSCFRVYRRSAVSGIKLQHEGFVGIAELLWRLDRRGGNIVECPAVLDVRKHGESKMRIGAATVEHLKLLGRALGDRSRDPIAARRYPL